MGEFGVHQRFGGAVFILAACLLAGASSPALARVAPKSSIQPNRPATADGDEALWVTQDDYPEEAMRNEWHGTSGLRLTISAEGRVIHCEVISSSGFEVLDAAACTAMTQRARFIPQTDRRGRPVPSFYSKRVRWQLPATIDPVEPVPGFNSVEGIIVRLFIRPDHQIGRCLVLDSDGETRANDPDDLCARMSTRFAAAGGQRVPPGGSWVEIRNLAYGYVIDPQWEGMETGDAAAASPANAAASAPAHATPAPH